MEREQFETLVEERAALKNRYQDGREKLDLIREAQADAIKRLNEWNILATSEIASETDDTGKARFSNQEKRNAELLTRQMNSQDFAVLEHAIGVINNDIAGAMNAQARLAIEIDTKTILIDYELSHGDIEIATERAVKRFFATRIQ
jgi:hypothetical protein